MTVTFDRYRLTDDGVELHFTVADPQPDQPAEYSVWLTEEELRAASTNSQLSALVVERLARQRQSDVVTARLDALVGAVLKV